MYDLSLFSITSSSSSFVTALFVLLLYVCPLSSSNNCTPAPFLRKAVFVAVD